MEEPYRQGWCALRKLQPLFLLLTVVAVWPPGSASTQEISTLPAAYEGLSRLHDLSAHNFDADVCISDVNGDGVEDILIVHRQGAGSVRMPFEDPSFQKGLAKAGFVLLTLNEVLKAKGESEEWKAELVYLVMFEQLSEVPLAELADCSGSFEDEEYRGCLIRAWVKGDRTDTYETLPAC